MIARIRPPLPSELARAAAAAAAAAAAGGGGGGGGGGARGDGDGEGPSSVEVPWCLRVSSSNSVEIFLKDDMGTEGGREGGREGWSFREALTNQHPSLGLEGISQTFTFDCVLAPSLDEEKDQEQVFEEVGRPLVEDVLRG